MTTSKWKTHLAVFLAVLSAAAALIGISGFTLDEEPPSSIAPQAFLRLVVTGGLLGFHYCRIEPWRDWQPGDTSDCPTPGFFVDDPNFTFTYTGPPPQGPPVRALIGRIPWHRRFVFWDWGRFDEYGGLVPSRRCPPQEPTKAASFVSLDLECHGLIVSIVLGVFPFVYFRNLARQRLRHKRGCCVKCGYDLTGNMAGVCPECGTAVDKKQ